MMANPQNYGDLGLPIDTLPVRSTDFQEEIALGVRRGIEAYPEFAYIEGLLPIDNEVIVSPNKLAVGSLFIPTVATDIEITFDPLQDGLGQTGATVLSFFHIDGDASSNTVGRNVRQDVTLDGTGLQTFALQTMGINRVVVTANGGAGFNNAAIDIKSSPGGDDMAFIPAQASVTQKAIVHVPMETGSAGILKFVKNSAIRDSGFLDSKTRFRGYVYSRITDTTYDVFRVSIDSGSQSAFEYDNTLGFRLESGDVFYITAELITGTNTDLTANMGINFYNPVG